MNFVYHHHQVLLNYQVCFLRQCKIWLQKIICPPPAILVRSVIRGKFSRLYNRTMHLSPMGTTTAGKNDLEQRNSTLESDFISWMYFKTIIGDVGPRNLYSGCNFLLPIQHGMALKGWMFFWSLSQCHN